MGVLSEKSNNSYKSAILLLSNSHYCNSIQCSYFSCLQLAKDKIITKSKYSPTVIEKMLQDSDASHIKIMQMAGDIIKGKNNEKSKMLDIMTRMKRWRKNATYDNVRFEENEASEAITNCETVMRLLNKN